MLGAEVVYGRDPVILKFHNGWLILNVGGGPTDDKPDVALEPPADPSRASAFLNLRVADIQQVYEQWSARGATFLTAPVDRGGGDPLLPTRPRRPPHRGWAVHGHHRGLRRKAIGAATSGSADDGGKPLAPPEPGSNSVG